ncbi:proprotein convertase P-domain-containing protein [Shewanella surugensis]|uniref:Proprotein convertase P-domain-containing protein n=2 Tax=Shewanella surugensis TaxID=212020 RepID=A0ABT0LAP8_9GAMM|nr:proprotein convertase P-domain-containing protein [Shewanella surugensis]
MLTGYSAFSDVELIADYSLASNFYENDTNHPIPDKDNNGAQSSITVNHIGDAGNINVEVNISHTYTGDLILELHSPTGEKHILQKKSGGGTDDIAKVYSIDMTGIEAQGDWILNVIDTVKNDIGTIEHWSITFL